MQQILRRITFARLAPALLALPLSLASPLAYAADDFDAASISKDSALIARLPTEIAAKGVLTIGSDTTYPPAEFLGGDDGQTPEGIDVDLAKAIAQKLGLKLEFLTAQFDSILPAIGPRYDLGISAFTITNERYKAVDFISYFNAGKQWAIQAGNPAKFNPDDPCGKAVGVQTGSTGEKAVKGFSDDCVAAKKKAIELISMPKQTDLVTRLINGAVDAVYAGSTNIGYAVKQTNGQLETIGAITYPSPNGIAVAKGQTAWAQLVADAINQLIADGTYQKILTKWGIVSAAVDKAEVNPKVSE
ncbi:ABC transporter substrate-binding protein [Rhizobium lusitanum]|uniref:Polar amino acid transport system substrate-binding protein n=1 Tax=Rhizobium lusitanum TaxID=293958 RepID=A0A1C3WCQ2_9HYPH|nr:ABC transporter substrate-binding protein [Rhizobium lusitanum]SCB37942.1 polar amino acid transport system substrate-binding protein [Rhizobium lusitanum]